MRQALCSCCLAVLLGACHGEVTGDLGDASAADAAATPGDANASASDASAPDAEAQTDAAAPDASATDSGPADAALPEPLDASLPDAALADAAALPDAGGSADASSPALVLAAFPGCQGIGCAATGGRGGDVYTVNTTEDTTNPGCAPQNGPAGATCSLRDCMTRSGPRTCVFSVGGTITLSAGNGHSELQIYPPPGDLTVAGQTAPGGGIQVKSDGTVGNGSSMIFLCGNNNVLRYLRLRPGLGPINSSDQGLSAISAGNDGDLEVIDHCSFQWDGNKAIAWGGNTTRTTLSWNLIAEGMAPHSTGLLMNGVTTGQAGLDQTSFDGHHNVLATYDHRLPYFNTKYIRWVNNLAFGYYYAALLRGNVHADLIGNVFDGFEAHLQPDPDRQEFRWADTVAHNEGQLVPGGSAPQFYLANNFGPHNPSGALDDFSTMLRVASSENSQLDDNPVAAQYKATGPTDWPSGDPWPITATALTTHTDLRALLAPSVGASQRLTCEGAWVANRDSEDEVVIGYILDPSLSPSECVTAPGTYPTLAPGTPCADGDGDGMPDVWEQAHGLDAADAADRNVQRPGAAGYTNLELYLSGLFPNGTALP